jgi:hypothetical protein
MGRKLQEIFDLKISRLECTRHGVQLKLRVCGEECDTHIQVSWNQDCLDFWRAHSNLRGDNLLCVATSLCMLRLNSVAAVFCLIYEICLVSTIQGHATVIRQISFLVTITMNVCCTTDGEAVVCVYSQRVRV